jgi:sulfite reductase (NADPH) flavoprotein alpha-component
VQDLLWEKRKDVWANLNEGASIYVCGNAKQMARDVESILIRIASSEGHLSEEDAHQFIKNLRANRRYLTDNY